MKRLRVALALLFFGLALPVGILVMRALQSAELERRVEYDAVAERIFDEMERTLSEFLAREEARAPDEYHFYRAQREEELPLERSSLSRSAAEPFVVAHFRIAPDGSLHTPLRPDDEAAAELAGIWPAPTADRQRIEDAIATLEREVAPFWRDAELRRRRPAALPIPAGGSREKDLATSLAGSPNSPAATPAEQKLDLQKNATPPKPEAGPDAGALATGDDPASAYEVLQSLNVAARKRAERREQLAEPEPLPDASVGEVRESAGSSEFRDQPALRLRESPRISEEWAVAKSPKLGAPLVGSSSDRAVPAPTEAAEDSDGFADSIRAIEEESASVEPATSRRSGARAQVILEPMTGHRIGDRYLLLFRTVVIDGEGFRQGLLIDRRALGSWLADQVIGAGPLAELASVRFDRSEPAPPDQAAHIASHPFAEPFSDLEAELRVSPLRDSDSATTVYLLAALLAIVGILGLGSVYRMTAVVVDFAERRSNFVAAVSHELKTPLTAIRMHGEMLRDGLVPDESRRIDYYRTITDESERLSRLIDNVLEFSRLDKGGRPLSPVVGSPVAIVADIVERLRPHAERAGFTLTAELADELPAVQFDRDALIQMIFNLVENAIKYAARAERREILVRCIASDGDAVAVIVRDFGPGVPREHLVRIFEPFHRVEDELTRSTKGSGIGLSLVKRLGEAMGASVRGNNPEDGGFEVRIGLAPARSQ